MPIYRFHLDVDVPRQIVADRLRAVVGDKPPFWKSLFTGWWSRDPASPPFVGIVDDDSFRVRRDIRYRNSFLPLVWGRFMSTPTGTRVNVIMFIHPLVALFMVFWLGTVGYGAFPGRFPFAHCVGHVRLRRRLDGRRFRPQSNKGQALHLRGHARLKHQFSAAARPIR